MGLTGFELDVTAVPSGWSMLADVSVSPEPAVKVDRMPVDWPTYMEEEDAVTVEVGTGGGVTVRVLEHVPVTLFGLTTVPVYVVATVGETVVEPE